MTSSLKLSIILPTLNERDNILPLLLAIEASLIGQDYEILFVDDSTDDTPHIIRQQTPKNSRIRIIQRAKKDQTGLATAFICGFQEARGEYLCCLDSDLQHPPQTIPLLLEKALRQKADIVIATRYATGASAKGLGNFYRRFVSLGTKHLVQLVFTPTRLTSDPGSGFFIFRKSILSNVILEPRGFKILIEILMRGHYDRNKVFDFPYQFLYRKNNFRKASWRQGWEFFRHLWHIFHTTPQRKK